MTFEELLKYKVRIMDDGVWVTMDVDEKNEINEELERKLEQEKE